MANNIAVMIHAYSQATGKSLTESVQDLNIDSLIDLNSIGCLRNIEQGMVGQLAKDIDGVVAWSGCRYRVKDLSSVPGDA